MKRSIPRSLVSKATNPDTPKEHVAGSEGRTEPGDAVSTPFKGAGSAWKSGALAQSQAAVERSRSELCSDILHGRHEISLTQDQISDPMGTDRRQDWMSQDAFRSLVSSIATNGQDTPILVWPEDPDWTPDSLDPTNVAGVPFVMLTGRRRLAAASELGIPLRAILAPPDARHAENSTFEMLFLRFRENEERENLSPFERLVSIGEMYETLASGEKRLTAVAFAKKIGVHESLVSRARAVFAAQEQILNAFKNVYDMSFRDLQGALASLESVSKPKAKPRAKPRKLTVKRKVGHRNLSVTSVDGNLSIKVAGMPIDQERLEKLGDLVASYLSSETPDKTTG
ncbi:replication protein [Salipiger aestuarii]|uniref:ParB N-terminal domain-containing protein n=1 Tax=Salipiger aestuarii TaxID=568098 RepID=UPI00025B6A32|nr:ParB N-terminal domain-containing protein [Salipiger aestuarii]EIE51248.1 RC101 [Citreicella sp. 357]KAA8606775.1 replication protein [Salipiger aestuarii]